MISLNTYQRRMPLPVRPSLPSILIKFLIYSGKGRLNLIPQLCNKSLYILSLTPPYILKDGEGGSVEVGEGGSLVGLERQIAESSGT